VRKNSEQNYSTVGPTIIRHVKLCLSLRFTIFSANNVCFIARNVFFTSKYIEMRLLAGRPRIGPEPIGEIIVLPHDPVAGFRSGTGNEGDSKQRDGKNEKEGRGKRGQEERG